MTLVFSDDVFAPDQSAGGEIEAILKEPFQLPPLLLRRPTKSCRETDSSFLSRPRVRFWRGQIFEELADEFGAHALIQQRQHFDCAKKPSGENGDLFARADVARRLHAVAADLYVPGVAGFRGQRAAFVKPHRPKPLVDAHTFRSMFTAVWGAILQPRGAVLELPGVIPEFPGVVEPIHLRVGGGHAAPAVALARRAIVHAFSRLPE